MNHIIDSDSNMICGTLDPNIVVYVVDDGDYYYYDDYSDDYSDDEEGSH